jgi:hypothetical protein
VNGQLNTVRYYRYFPKSFAIAKRLVQEGFYNVAGIWETLNDERRDRVGSTETLQQLHDAVGKDFYVIVPCPSIRTPGTTFEGTRLTLLTHQPEGFEFTIRTPGTPLRWQQFDEELTASFDRLVASLVHAEKASPPSFALKRDSASSGIGADFTGVVLQRALEFFYLLANFAPLSRGTAICGYAALQAIMLSRGHYISESLPKGTQLDWEAILSKDFHDFSAIATKHLIVGDKIIDISRAAPMDDAIPTLRAMIAALDLEEPTHYVFNSDDDCLRILV